MNIFELLHERYKLPVKPKLFEAFSGIGCQLMAFKRLGIEVESIGFSEIDKYAIQSYRAIHGDIKNWGSITDIKGADLPHIDVFTYSFPCTDLSKAGKQKGLTDTRSGLVYEVLRILRELDEVGRKPQVLIMENVVDLVQSKFIKQFQEIQVELEKLGYTNYTQTLNAKKYGVAQNRDRVFMVSILGDYYYEFPKPIPLEKRLKDYLEVDVDEKYYLSDKMLSCFTDMTDRNGLVRGDRFNPHDVDESKYAFAITTLAGNRATDNYVIEPAILTPKRTEYGKSIRKFYEGGEIKESRHNMTKLEPRQDGISNTLTTVQKDNLVIEPIYLNSKVDGKQPSLSDRIYDSESIACAVTTSNFFMPNYTVNEPSGNDVGVVVNAKQKLCNAMLENGNLDKYDMIRHSYTNKRMENLDRKESTDGISATLTTRSDTLGVVVPFGSYYTWSDNQGNINTQCNRAADEDGYALTVACAETGKVAIKEDKKVTPFYIFDLCGTIDVDRSEKYERSRELLQVLWREITKEEIWEEIGRLFNIYKENILQQRLYEKGLFENRETQSNNNKFKNNCEENKRINIEERLLRDMWGEFKNRYTPHRWELEQQQFDKLNDLMSKLPYETTQKEIEMLNLWEKCQGLQLLQQTLHSLQKIWRSNENEEQSKRLRIRKLSPIEVWRLMGIDDEDFYKASQVCSNAQLYKQAGNGIVVDVFASILRTMT